MKKALFFSILFLIFSCKNTEKKQTTTLAPHKAQALEVLGQEIFEGKGNCAACHLIDQKVVGPSIQQIAKIYKSKNGSLVAFLKNDAKPIVDPSQYEVMKTNFGITKNLTDIELKALEAYIYSK